MIYANIRNLMSKSISENLLSNGSYCPPIFGTFCWPQTPSNSSVNISCNVLRHAGIDQSSLFKDIFFIQKQSKKKVFFSFRIF